MEWEQHAEEVCKMCRRRTRIHSQKCLLFLDLDLFVRRGLSIVGKAAVGMTFFIVAPFVVMGIIAVPHIQPRNWLVCDLKAVQWGPFINVMFWCGSFQNRFAMIYCALSRLNNNSASASAVLKKRVKNDNQQFRL